MYNEQEFTLLLQQMKKAQVALEVAIGLFGFEHPTTLEAAEKLEKHEDKWNQHWKKHYENLGV